MASHWLNCDSLSLARLLPGEGKPLSSYLGSEVRANAVSPCKIGLLVGFAIDERWSGMSAPPAGLPTPF